MSVNGRADADQSLGQLVSSVTSNVSSLVRLEIELAKSEISEQVKQGAVGGGMAAVAGFLVLLAIILLSIAAALGLATVMPGWAAFLVVAGAYLLIAALLVFIGIRRFKRIKGPQRASASFAETKSVLAQRAQVRGDAKASGMSVAELKLHESDERARIAAREAAGRSQSAPTGS
jgi:membrane protein implicated in regulation of membrane protease activity